MRRYLQRYSQSEWKSKEAHAVQAMAPEMCVHDGRGLEGSILEELLSVSLCSRAVCNCLTKATRQEATAAVKPVVSHTQVPRYVQGKCNTTSPIYIKDIYIYIYMLMYFPRLDLHTVLHNPQQTLTSPKCLWPDSLPPTSYQTDYLGGMQDLRLPEE